MASDAVGEGGHCSSQRRDLVGEWSERAVGGVLVLFDDGA
jgi:hypothetical protein